MGSVRNNPFSRNTPSPAPGRPGRPKSVAFPTSSPLSGTSSPPSSLHGRNQSLTSLATALQPSSTSRHGRGYSREGTPTSNTFAPSFIKAEEARKRSGSGSSDERERETGVAAVGGIEGENDFSGKRYVWIKDPQTAFVRGWVVEGESQPGQLLVQCDDGTQRHVDAHSVDKVNPAKFDKADDMAELTHLNEASVVHNLHTRYQADLIYTYSGLFLVTVNPYRNLPIYTNDYVQRYRGRSREDSKPHVFSMADEAFRNLVDEGRNQSILVTGESGAGKTENTKKVIQYLAAVAKPQQSSVSNAPAHSSLSAQILRANPILEAFGNAQTVRNHNSSRFGKFIRIELTRSGSIAGAFIDWYLLEKSRVVRVNAHERNYHVFYQLLKGASPQLRQTLRLDDMGVQDFAYTRSGHDTIAGVSDADEWAALLEAFAVMGFSADEQTAILRTVAAVLHLGNVAVVKEGRSVDQARLAPEARDVVDKVCGLLGVDGEEFVRGLLHPRVRAGREWVEKAQTPEQVRLGLDALAKGIYERGFGDLVGRINGQLGCSTNRLEEGHFIGVLDIAGFEIFEHNSFEQLCINYTNEKLQQFFNHHMFVLEQEEYAREQIEWAFIDFGRDLQPTIDLIELAQPIGIFSCLDEDCVMPKATDRTFTEKLNGLWERRSPKYRPSRVGGAGAGFVLTHYAAEVEYTTDGWLEKNKDPLNDNITRLLAASTDAHMAALFSDSDKSGRRGLFRTVAQRHKEQLSSLMAQLHSTHPHFVRCILPNHDKRPGRFDGRLVLDQLRCNGVLEGIRIARTGFPNRLPFAEFRQRYEVLCRGAVPKGLVEGREAAAAMLGRLGLDAGVYRVGLTKVFFRAGVLAELEEQRDALITAVLTRFQAVARGSAQRRLAHKRLYRAEAALVVRRNLRAYLELCENPWWQLVGVGMRPLLATVAATRPAAEVRRRDETIRQLQQDAETERRRLEAERHACQAEAAHIQQTLESERALALDKEAIFQRLQAREAELEDKLAGALDDQERLEEQLDGVVAARKKAEADAEACGQRLEQAAGLMGRLEEDKAALTARVAELEGALTEVTEARQETDTQAAARDTEVKMLQSQLALRERKARDLEAKLLAADEKTAAELHAAQKELQACRAQRDQLASEKGDVQQQLADLSKTSTDYEDLVRRKEAELHMLREDKQRHEAEQHKLQEERKRLNSERDTAAERLHAVQAELEATQARQGQLAREAQEAERLLQARLSEDAQADQDRQRLAAQVADLKSELYAAQVALSRERQSRDDVQLLGEHKLEALQEAHDHLNETKITIEKELYAQQDTLRRTAEARATAERERDEARQEVVRLRAAKAEAEEARREAEAAGERAASRAAREREETMRRELEAAQEHTDQLEAECAALGKRADDLGRLVATSGEFSLKSDRAKERLERELQTVRSRLAASENDNRALLNKLQQKGLEIARSASRASEATRTQVQNLQRDKARAEEQATKLQTQLGDAQLAAAGLEKRVEKLQLTVEDLQHEAAREAKQSRSAEKASSTSAQQLAEAQRTLRARDAELAELRSHLQGAVQVVGADSPSSLPRKIEELQKALREKTQARPLEEISPNKITPNTPPRKLNGHTIDDLQDRLHLAEMQNRHLRSQVERSTPPSEPPPLDDSPSRRRAHKLEKANSRLHAMLDDSTKRASAMEKALHTGELSLRDIETRSHEEILELVRAQEETRRTLARGHDEAVAELAEAKEAREKLRRERAQLEVDLRDARSELRDEAAGSKQKEKTMLAELSDLQVRLDAESGKLVDVTAGLNLYKSRADEYFAKLEQAEMAVLKAHRAEQFARTQAREAEDSCAEAVAERQRLDAAVEDLQTQNQRLEERLEDAATDLEAATQAKRRLQHELEDYRAQRATEIEDKESGMEQTRQKYQAEFASLTRELDLAREERLRKQAEIARLREELDELRAKWDDEVLNSTTWSKEKARLDATLADVAASRDEAARAHHEAQAKVVSLLSQVRELRSSVDEAAAERDALAREKRGVEARLAEAKAGLDELVGSGSSPSRLRDAAAADREILELKSGLAQQQDVAAAAAEKMRRAEALAAEMQRDMAAERDAAAALLRQKSALEKSLNEAQLRLIDLETKGYSTASQDIKFLHKRIQELESNLEAQETERSRSQRSVRNVDRTVKDLQGQVDRRDKQNAQLQDDLARMRDKADKLLRAIDDLQASESTHELSARRAERELREERDKSAKLERELEGWKSLRVEKGSNSSAVGSLPRRLGTWRSGDDDAIDIPKRKSSAARVPSLTKGFL